MKERYLKVTYRNGRLLAAYLYLPRDPGDTSSRTERPEAGLAVDYTADGRAIGVEITAPSKASLVAINRILAAVHQEPATPDELAPVLVAGRGTFTAAMG